MLKKKSIFHAQYYNATEKKKENDVQYLSVPNINQTESMRENKILHFMMRTTQ